MRLLFAVVLGGFLWLAISSGVPAAQAMIAPLSVTPGHVSNPISNGVVTGGTAANEFTLLKVNREVMPRQGRSQGGEKWILTYGDRMGRPLGQEIGFFHINVDRHAKRVVIDLAQVNRSSIDRSALLKLTQGSHLVANSEMVMDPQDRSTNLTLNLRSPVEVKVLNKGSSGGQLVLFLSPILPTKQ